MTLPRVFILAGGFGTRLAGVLKDLPKPMAPIQGRPFLEYQIEFLKKQGFTKFTLLTGYLANTIEEHFGGGRRFGVEIDYSVEQFPLGTGGAIRQAFQLHNDNQVLVLNGDSFFTTDYSRFVRLASGPVSLALKFSKDLSRYGAVTINDEYKITNFAEKSSTIKDGYLNAGAYLIDRSALKYFPEGKSSIEKEIFEPLSQQNTLAGIPCGGKFIDIGTPESLSWAQENLPEWLNQEPRPCLFLDRDGVIVKHVNYLHEIEKVEIVPEVVELIRAARAKGWYVAAVSNQSGVGRGLFSAEQCSNVNEFIQRELKKQDAGLDSWNCCFEHPKEGQGDHKRESLRRKPGPGMALEVCENFPVDLSRSLMIGDNSTDQLQLPDLKTILVQGDYKLDLIKDQNIKTIDFQHLLEVSKQLIASSLHRSAAGV